MTNTFARLTNLKPDTLYHFQIKDSEVTSRTMSFRTAPDKPQPFSFIAGGDSRNNREARTAGNLLVSKLRPLFVLFGGDYAVSVNPRLCKNWLDDWQAIRSTDGRIYPIMPTYGNHEGADHKILNKLFDIKNNNSYYALNIGGKMLRTYALNSELQFRKGENKWGKQTKWLKKDLQQHTDTIWKIAAYHRPLRPHQKNKAEMIGSINCYPPNISESIGYLSLAGGQSSSEGDFSGHYEPHNNYGDSYIEYEFFNMNNEDENVKVVVQFATITVGINENVPINYANTFH